ncbi:MAG TPA: hypothetical protein VNE62_06425 [Actinomycetota bacterium]|nr:hypothetical protein [Actinomycetota bacterium]
MRKLTALGVGLALAIGMVTGGSPAGATDRGELKISPIIKQVSKAYPAIAAVRPNACSTPAGCVSTPYAQTQAPGCRDHNQAYCDAIRLHIERPEGYMDDLYEVWIDLAYDRGIANNKMDLYVFNDVDPIEEQGYVLGPSVVDNRKDETPKSVRLGAPDSGTLSLSVVNERGVNSGYTLTVRWVEIDLGPDYNLGDAGASAPSFSTPGSFGNAGSPASIDDSTPIGYPDGKPIAAKTRKVLIPGPDGELRSVALPVIARGERSSAGSSGVSNFTVFLIMLLLTSAAAVGFFALRMRRQQA